MAADICIIIPAYNAGRTIGAVVSGALTHCPDVFVADDGSMDNTGDSAADAGAKVIRIPFNRGKGNALKVLFDAAREKGYEAVISMDADGQHDPDAIPLFIEKHKKSPHNIIVGSRMAERDRIPRARLNSMQIANFYASLASNQFLEDTQCGYRLYPLGLISQLLLTTGGYVTETEILIKAGDSGNHISFIDIEAIYNHNGSHFRAIRDFSAITAYVISYLTIKWIIEGACPDRPYTYSRGGVRDRLARNRVVNGLFQTATVFTALPITLFFWMEYVLFGPFINNFASVRRLGCGYLKIAAATYMLPVMLAVLFIEKLLDIAGVQKGLTDAVVKKFYRNVWNPEQGTAAVRP